MPRDTRELKRVTFFWLIGAMFIWRWGYIRALRRQNDSNGVEK